MTEEEKADLQAEMKAAMAKTREQNLKYIKENNLGGMIAAREGLDKLKKKGSTANRRKSLCAAATRPNTAGRLGAPRCRAGTPPLPSRMRQGALQVISL